MAIRISNNKLSALNKWATFKGFSILFDNPRESYTSADNGLVQINCNAKEKRTKFYTILHQSIAKILPEFPKDNTSFCPLPLSSYHVTLWDGVNHDNIDKLKPEFIESTKTYIEELPGSFCNQQAFHSIIKSSLAEINSTPDVHFMFDKLTIWKTVLVARIKPANEVSLIALEQLKSIRLNLILDFKENFGNIFSERHMNYSPHISLGYFANPEYGGSIRKEILNNWTSIFMKQTKGITLRFSGAGLYGFSDMVTFFTLPKQ